METLNSRASFLMAHVRLECMNSERRYEDDDLPDVLEKALVRATELMYAVHLSRGFIAAGIDVKFNQRRAATVVYFLIKEGSQIEEYLQDYRRYLANVHGGKPVKIEGQYFTSYAEGVAFWRLKHQGCFGDQFYIRCDEAIEAGPPTAIPKLAEEDLAQYQRWIQEFPEWAFTPDTISNSAATDGENRDFDSQAILPNTNTPLQPAKAKSFLAYNLAVEEMSGTLGATATDREVYDWIKEHGAPERFPFSDWKPPDTFKTFQRYVSEGRGATETQKGPPPTPKTESRSVQKASNLDISKGQRTGG